MCLPADRARWLSGGRTGREAIDRPANGVHRTRFRSLVPHAPTRPLVAWAIPQGRPDPVYETAHLPFDRAARLRFLNLPFPPRPRGPFFAPPTTGLFVLPAFPHRKINSRKNPNKHGGSVLSWFLTRLNHTPLIWNNALTAQTDNRVPSVTGRKAAINAHNSIRRSGRCLRWSTKTMLPAKQIAGVITTVSIQGKGVADQSALNPLDALYSQAATNHSPEQMRSAIEIADVETRCREKLCEVLI
jgi:hypothetical protein